jgi:hypothetical protein
MSIRYEHRKEGDRRLSQQDSIFGVKSSYEKGKRGWTSIDINPIVRKARMAEHCDIVPFRMIGDTRIEVPIRKFTAEKHTVRADWLDRRGAQPGSPAGFDWPGWIFIVVARRGAYFGNGTLDGLSQVQ